MRGFVEDDGVCEQVAPLYGKRLLDSLVRLQQHIPPSELTIQWDLPAEIAALEYERGSTGDRYWKAYFSPVKAGILDRLERYAKAVSPDAEMGPHLCLWRFRPSAFRTADGFGDSGGVGECNYGGGIACSFSDIFPHARSEGSYG